MLLGGVIAASLSGGRGSVLEGEGSGLRLLRVRVWVEMAAALSAGALGLLTTFWRDWIELLIGWDPDQHNGSVEWILVLGLVAVAVAAGLAARRHWRLLTADAGQ